MCSFIFKSYLLNSVKIFGLYMFAVCRISAVADDGGKFSPFKYICSFIWIRKKGIEFGNQ